MLFSGDDSKELWHEINSSRSIKDLRRALYTVCCRCQEFEAVVASLERRLIGNKERRKTERAANKSKHAQQLKPKMPSYEEFDDYCESIKVDGVQCANLFRYFACHFGH